MADHRREIETEMHNDEMEIDLGRLFLGMWKSFRKLWWMVLALALAGALLFTVYQRVFREPVYACTATFTVTTGDESSGSYSFYYDSTTADQMSKTFPYILESGFFRNALMEQLGTDTLNGTITAETIEDSNVVTMRAESPDAGSARNILDAALEIYPQTARFVLGAGAVLGGFLAGPAIAGVFISEDSAGNMSFAEPFYIMTAGFLISAVWLIFALPSDRPEKIKKIDFFEGVKDMLKVLKDKRFRTLTSIFVIGNLGGGCYAMTIPIYLLESFNFSAKLLAWYMAFGSIISAFSYIVITPLLVRKFDKTKLCKFCYLLVGLAALIAYLAAADWQMWLCNVLFMLSFCTAYSACLDAYSEMVGENRRAWILSVVLSIWGLASGGGLVLSSAGIAVNTHLTLLFSALLLFVGLCLPTFAGKVNSAK